LPRASARGFFVFEQTGLQPDISDSAKREHCKGTVRCALMVSMRKFTDAGETTVSLQQGIKKEFEVGT